LSIEQIAPCGYRTLWQVEVPIPTSEWIFESSS